MSNKYEIIERDDQRYAVGLGNACNPLYMPGMTWDCHPELDMAREWLIEDPEISQAPRWEDYMWYVILLPQTENNYIPETSKKVCQWEYVEKHQDGPHYATGCEHYIITDEPAYEGVWKYCPHCGGKIEVVK